MRHLKHCSRAAKYNGGAWILLFLVIILVPPITATPHLVTPLTNQLPPSIRPSTSQLLNSQESWLQEPAVIKRSNPTNHLTSINMEGVEMNIATHTSEAFEGYNLFGLIQLNQPDTNKKNCLFLITNMEGEIIAKYPAGIRDIPTIPSLLAKFINSTTILLAMKNGAALWNIYDNNTVPLDFWGHHEYEYNSINNTFFTFSEYVIEIGGMKYVFDVIEEYTTTGLLIWSLDTQSFISYTQMCPYRDMMATNFWDVTHSNSLFFDTEEDVLYYHARNLNTFYKIDHKTGQVLWGLGEHGNFTLFDRRGNTQKNLFYHAHAVEKVDDHTFILFDNDYHNQTNPNNRRSRLLEITINEITMTANVSWAWIALPDYYSGGLGDADRLPNGNRLGTFGTEWHPDSSIGARLVEVNATGQIVWELNFPNTEKFLYCVYRMERFRLSPILSSPPNIRASSRDNVTVNWQTWYSFRTNRRMRGTYTLYLDGKPIEHGPHMFDKFWRPTNLTINLGKLEVGNHSCMLALADEAGHITTDSLNIKIIKTFYLEREGPLTTELGQKNAQIHWKGYTPNPLWATLARNNTQVASFMWNGSIITLDLNSLEVGTYFVALHLFNNTEQIYEDRFFMTIYPAAAPIILSFPADQPLTWNASFVLSWELFDHSPASWRILVNATLTAWGSWETPSYLLTWNIPTLNEGCYNVTLVVYDRADHQTARTTWLTVVSPSPPVIATVPHQTEIQWGQKNASLRWEIHGGTHWALWKNGTEAYGGEVTSHRIEVRIENWQRDWQPGTYNLTLQVADEGGAAATSTSWIRIWVNLGDAYADLIVPGLSMWYWDGEHALGPPDGKFARLYFGYGNGHVTLDMGLDEEILDGNGVDFTVYARGGSYAVFVGNNITAPLLVGTQTLPPLTVLGEGFGNTSFDLASADLTQARYIQIVYIAGEETELDAVVAVYFDKPPRSASNLNRWRIPVSGAMLALFAIIILWVRKRK